jgi:hypothetical protein
MQAGIRFNRLVAVAQVGIKPDGTQVWRFDCNCGKTIFVPYSRVKFGHTKSCGCLQREKVSARGTHYEESLCVNAG